MSNRTGRRVVARCAIQTLLLSGWLIGCELSPPAGSYDAQTFDERLGTSPPNLDGGKGVEVEASVPVFLGGGAGGSTPGAAGMAGGGQTGLAGGQGGAGGVGGAGGTTGGSVSPELARLQKLAGYYFMRMDMRSTVSAQSPLGEVKTRNRVSHLLVTQLKVDEQNQQLVGLEQLCHQTFEIICERGCRDPQSSLRPEVRNELLKVRPTRNYQVTGAGSTLRIAGDQQTLYLGFDSTSNKTLPTNTADTRVWLNGTADSTREGMWLYLDTRSESGLLRIQCDVYTVQSFVSKFDGMLQGSLDEPSFVNMAATLNSAGSDGKTIGATNRDCADDPSNPATTTSVGETVRLAPANVVAAQEAAFWNCPDVSAWDGPLPPPAP